VTNLRRGFHRIFAVLVVCWCAYRLFVAPVFMAQRARVHYENEFKECYEDYGPYGRVSSDKHAVASCLAESKREFATGLYSGFGFTWKEVNSGPTKGTGVGKGSNCTLPGTPASHARHLTWTTGRLLTLLATATRTVQSGMFTPKSRRYVRQWIEHKWRAVGILQGIPGKNQIWRGCQF
jgi:hypothetical protein